LFRAVIRTFAPSAAKPSATARPMPTLPPVMTASFPLSPRSMSVVHPDLQFHIRGPRFHCPVEGLDRVLEAEGLRDQRLEVDAARGHQRDGPVVLVRIAEHRSDRRLLDRERGNVEV